MSEPKRTFFDAIKSSGLEETIEKLFSAEPRTVKDILVIAQVLVSSSEAGLIKSPTPYIIKNSAGEARLGMSTNMKDAVRAIIATLEQLDPEAVITLDIDPNRLNSVNAARLV